MTPGQEALAEAARIESARVYSRTLEQHRAEQTPLTPGEQRRLVEEQQADAIAEVIDLQHRRSVS